MSERASERLKGSIYSLGYPSCQPERNFLDAVLRGHRLRPVSHVQVTVDHRDEPSRHHRVGIVCVVVTDVNLRRRSSCDRFVLDSVAVIRAGRRDEGLNAEGSRPGMIAWPRLLCCNML